MRETMIILRRELRGYFLSPIAYVFGVLFLLGQLIFSTEVLKHGMPSHANFFFLLLPIVMLFFVPALTMRLWAEERKLGTIELLMTFPAKLSHLVLGKFFAALGFLLLILVLTLPLQITLDFYGDLDWGPVLAAYGAAILMASSFLAVGMFFSSLTRDQIIAMLLTLVTLGTLMLLGIPWTLTLIDSWGAPDWLIAGLAAVSPFKYFMSIARGVLDTGDLVYYLCFCSYFLFANTVVLNHRRIKG